MKYPCEGVDGTELLIDYVSGALPPDQRFVFDRHLNGCKSCTLAVEEQSRVWAALDEWNPSRIAADFDAAVFAKIAMEQDRPWYQKLFDGTWAMRPAMPLAAACAAVIAVFLIGGPVAEERHPAPVIQSTVDLQKVERALDDLDMLQQLGVVPKPKTKILTTKSI